MTGIARHLEAIPTGLNITARVGDASSIHGLSDLIVGSDAVVSALHFDIPASTLLSALKMAGVGRLLVTGGAGSLEIAPHVRLIDAPDFPSEFKPIAQGGIDFLEGLRAEEDIDWTFFSPPLVIEEAPRLGHYRLGLDQLVLDKDGESRISFADYALAMADEVEQNRHIRRRFTAAY